jgi:hypothetical protein
MPVGTTVYCEEKDLVSVFPQYVTFTTFSNRPMDGKGIALLHERMDLLKSFVTRTYARDGILKGTVKIYEIYKGVPQLLYELPEGSNKSDSDLWKKKPKDRAVAVDEDEIAAAIASITGGS